MDLNTIFVDESVLSTVAFVGGIVAAILTHQFLNRRSLFTYFVFHQRIGVSATDEIFGSVRVTFNDNPVNNLFLSTVELINQSLTDFENVDVTIYTGDTRLLSHRTELANTPLAIAYAPDFIDSLVVPAGQEPTAAQFALYNGQRRFRISTLNRNQKAVFHFINASESSDAPKLFVDVTKKGIKLKYAIAQPQFWGVGRHRAAIAGLLLGLVLIAVLIAQVEVVWIASVIAFIYGLSVVVPGALIIRGWRWLRDWYSG